MCFDDWLIGSAIVRRYGLGVKVICWKNYVSVMVGFADSHAQSISNIKYIYFCYVWVNI